MSLQPSVLLLEFNELSPPLMERWMEEGKLPNFRRLYRESQIYVTDAEEEAPNLVPWIQWITVHSGLSYGEHKVFHLGDAARLQEPNVWDILSSAGYRVWVCGSMNARYETPLNGALLPDPWAKDVAPHPEALTPYFRFVRQHVMDYTKSSVPLGATDYLKFMAFMVRHRMSIETVRAIAGQLSSEAKRRQRWKRAVILDRLQFDVFRSYWRALKPHFATFFSNSTAHFQHAYWRNMAPHLFTVQPSAEEQLEYQDAILFGYQQMDNLVARFLELALSNTTVIFCTALSQQPCLLYEEQGGKVFYRPRDFKRFLDFASVHPGAISPVMSEQFHLTFEHEAAARGAAARLAALRVGSRQVMDAHVDGRTIFAGCRIFEQLPPDAALRSDGDGGACPFFDLFYQVEAMKSGMHHPDGMLWIRTPGRAHTIHPGKVSLLSITPTILDMFSLPRAAYMRGGSLLTGMTVDAPLR